MNGSDTSLQGIDNAVVHYARGKTVQLMITFTTEVMN